MTLRDHGRTGGTGGEVPPVPLVLDILRHGEAEAAGARGDDARPLSASGRRAMAALGASLAQEDWRPDRIFSSPLLRARETAEIVRGAIPGAPSIESMEELTADRDPHDVLVGLTARGVLGGHALLVTHQPLAGRLTALTSGEAPAIAPGTLIRVVCAPDAGSGRGRLVRYIAPAPRGA